MELRDFPDGVSARPVQAAIELMSILVGMKCNNPQSLAQVLIAPRSAVGAPAREASPSRRPLIRSIADPVCRISIPMSRELLRLACQKVLTALARTKAHRQDPRRNSMSRYAGGGCRLVEQYRHHGSGALAKQTERLDVRRGRSINIRQGRTALHGDDLPWRSGKRHGVFRGTFGQKSGNVLGHSKASPWWGVDGQLSFFPETNLHRTTSSIEQYIGLFDASLMGRISRHPIKRPLPLKRRDSRQIVTQDASLGPETGTYRVGDRPLADEVNAVAIVAARIAAN